MPTILQRAAGLSRSLEAKVKNVNDLRKKRRESKRQSTKEKYDKQIKAEAEKLKQIQAKNRKIQAQLRNQAARKGLKSSREKVIINRIESLKDIGGSAKRIAQAVTGKPKKKKKSKKRKKKKSKKK